MWISSQNISLIFLFHFSSMPNFLFYKAHVQEMVGFWLTFPAVLFIVIAVILSFY